MSPSFRFTLLLNLSRSYIIFFRGSKWVKSGGDIAGAVLPHSALSASSFKQNYAFTWVCSLKLSNLLMIFEK